MFLAFLSRCNWIFRVPLARSAQVLPECGDVRVTILLSLLLDLVWWAQGIVASALAPQACGHVVWESGFASRYSIQNGARERGARRQSESSVPRARAKNFAHVSGGTSKNVAIT